MTGGVPHQKTTTESDVIERIYIGGYQDGSARIWDATFPVLSLVSLLKFEVCGVFTENLIFVNDFLFVCCIE